MRTLYVASATTLLVLAGCSTETEPEAASKATTATHTAPTETPIAIGKPFSISGPNYTTAVTIERVYVPQMCGDTANSSAAIQANVEVESGDGTSEVLNTDAIRERTPDGYLQKDRIIAQSCDGVEELDATNVQTGDKYRGVIWLNDDVSHDSEMLINAPTDGEPISVVFVLDLGALDLETAPPAETAVAQPSATAPAAPAAPAAPTVVECLNGTPGPALWSDGTMDFSEWCFQTRGGPAYLENERNSGF